MEHLQEFHLLQAAEAEVVVPVMGVSALRLFGLALKGEVVVHETVDAWKPVEEAVEQVQNPLPKKSKKLNKGIKISSFPHTSNSGGGGKFQCLELCHFCFR